jgi:hypothetical protein
MLHEINSFVKKMNKFDYIISILLIYFWKILILFIKLILNNISILSKKSPVVLKQ